MNRQNRRVHAGDLNTAGRSEGSSRSGGSGRSGGAGGSGGSRGSGGSGGSGGAGSSGGGGGGVGLGRATRPGWSGGSHARKRPPRRRGSDARSGRGPAASQVGRARWVK